MQLCLVAVAAVVAAVAARFGFVAAIATTAAVP
jgi:hypothetical protein